MEGEEEGRVVETTSEQAEGLPGEGTDVPKQKSMFLMTTEELDEQIRVYMDHIGKLALNLEQARIHLGELLVVKGSREYDKAVMNGVVPL